MFVDVFEVFQDGYALVYVRPGFVLRGTPDFEDGQGAWGFAFDGFLAVRGDVDWDDVEFVGETFLRKVDCYTTGKETVGENP